MKIIKRGDPAALAKLTQRFECKRCGCIFEATWSEYDEAHVWKNRDMRTCECPECRKKCEEVVVYD